MYYTVYIQLLDYVFLIPLGDNGGGAVLGALLCSPAWSQTGSVCCSCVPVSIFPTWKQHK